MSQKKKKKKKKKDCGLSLRKSAEARKFKGIYMYEFTLNLCLQLIALGACNGV
jgi:hypothetical protein